MIKPMLIVLLLIASIKMGFANDHCHDKKSVDPESVTETVLGPMTEIRNPSR